MLGIPVNISQEILINKPVKEVYETITNFNTWKNWSPWMCMEPTAKVETNNPWGVLGHSQSWEGNLVGSGRMTLASLQMNEKIVCDLEFFKPWKSQSKAIFTLTAEGSQTRVKWDMESKLPFFMFFFKKMMAAMITNDFKRGLSMLKEFMESGVVLTDTKITGTEKKPGFYYVGVEHDAKIADLGPLMKKDFTSLGSCFEKGSLPQPKFMLAVYHKFDMINGKCEFTSAFAYNSEQDAQNAMKGFASVGPLKISKVEEHTGFQVMHTGAYENLGNAWSTAMSAQRQQKLKSDKNVDMYEVYVNTPLNAPIKDLKTQIVIPVR